MSQKPVRSRPAARTLVASVEPINTGAAQAPERSPEPPSVAPAAEPQRMTASKAAPPTAAASSKSTSTTVSLKMRDALIAQAKTAVLKTAGNEGGYRSFVALVQGAVERELQRLAVEFNDGAPFEEHEGEFRRGRPLS